MVIIYNQGICGVLRTADDCSERLASFQPSLDYIYVSSPLSSFQLPFNTSKWFSFAPAYTFTRSMIKLGSSTVPIALPVFPG
jgi:hypothetical protein